MQDKQVIIIQGPTAIGKTSLSIDIAKHYNTEIVSADSRQFYKELLIGSSPPSESELKEVNHHFIQHLSISEKYNIGKFENDAIKRINKLFKRYDKIVVVGGSGLYIEAICQGIDEIPNIKKEMRDKIINLYKKKGLEFLQAEIHKYDKSYFSQVDRQNPQRLMRALEVIYSTGKTFSSFRKGKKCPRDFQIVRIGLKTDRDLLYKRINKRVDEMIDRGLVKEVESLIPYRTNNALQTVGYQELFEYLEGVSNLTDSIENIKRNTRRLAKRQLTWLRRYKQVEYFHKENIDDIIKFIE